MSDDGFLSRWSRRKAQVRQGVAQPEPLRPEPPSTVAPHPGPLPEGEAVDAATPPVEAVSPLARDSGTEGERPPPPPTLEDVAALPRGAEIGRFMAPAVDEDVKRAALKKLFADPHFNVMDGLDVYIDDYGKPNPIPLAILKQLAQSRMLGLFEDEERADAEAAVPGHAAAGAEADAAAAQRPEADAPPVAGATAEEASPDGAPMSAVPKSPIVSPAVPSDEDPDLRLQQDHAARPRGPGEGAAG